MVNNKFFDIIPPQKIPEVETSPLSLRQKTKQEPEALPPKIKRRVGGLNAHKRIPWGKVLMVLLVLAVVSGGILILELKGMQIEIWPVSQQVSFKDSLTVDVSLTELNFSQKLINGQFLEAEKTLNQEFLASGRGVKETEAQGVIRVYNTYHLSQILIAGTRFLSADDKMFRSLKRVEIPAGGFADVEVKAVQPGDGYNIGPAIFSVPGLVGTPRYTAVYGKSALPMKGGFKGEVHKVTKEDLEKAKSALIEKLKEGLKEVSAAKAGENLILLNDAFTQEVVEASSLTPAGTEIDKFNFKATMRSSALVFKKETVENFAKEFILAKVGERKQIQDESLALHYKIQSADMAAGKLAIELEFSAKVYDEINTASLLSALQGKSLKEVKVFLKENSQIARAEIKLWPFWLRRVPSQLPKIKIEVKI